MALDATIKQQLNQYLALLESDLVFTVSLDETEDSKKVLDFLEEIVAMSSRLSLEKATLARTPSFEISSKEQPARCCLCRVTTRT